MATHHEAQPIDTGPYAQRTYRDSDPNFENLVSNWSRYSDRLILFLGAGASVGAQSAGGAWFPTAVQLRDSIWREFMLPVADKDSFDYRNLGLMTLEHAAALAEARADRASVIDFTARLFRARFPLWHHCTLPFLHPRAVLTTNYDDLIEMGWAAVRGSYSGLPIHAVYNSNTVLQSDWIPLYKPHGSAPRAGSAIGDGGLVVTQFDYFEILNDREYLLDNFFTKFNESCVIFVGYNFQDMDIASSLFNLRLKHSGPRWYAVFPREDSDVRNMYQERYGIRVISRTFHDFIVELDAAVDFLPHEWKRTQLSERVSERRIASGTVG